MRAQSFKNGVRLSCSYIEFVQLRMALSARRSELKQTLSGSEDADALDVASFYLDMCNDMYDEMSQL